MAVKTLEAAVSVSEDPVITEKTDGVDDLTAASPTVYSSLNRTLTGWEVLFFTFIVLLGTALLVDLWFLLHPGS
jgi:hypothetical protein